jgi:hypothetical protein
LELRWQQTEESKKFLQAQNDQLLKFMQSNADKDTTIQTKLFSQNDKQRSAAFAFNQQQLAMATFMSGTVSTV